MKLNLQENRTLLIVSFLVLLTRIPFLFAGYGSEEDAWGLILTARNINLSGIYEVSRFPGHPVQELMLSLIWNWPAWSVNLLTSVISSVGVLFFMLTLKHLKFPKSIQVYAGLALAFTPVFYINSTNIMDYNWALSLVLISFYFLVRRKILYSGIILGIACGFRITAGAMVLPFILWHFFNYRSWKTVIYLCVLTAIVGVTCYLPVYRIYGTGFFTYYEYFPYPSLLKNVYKATIGAWGIVGTVAVTAAGAAAVAGAVRGGKKYFREHNSLIWMCLLTIAIYMYSFLKIPQKSAFILPMVPFIIIIFAAILNKKHLIVLSLSLLVSCFFLGMNLDDPFRGSKASPLSVKTQIGQTPVAIDLISGLVIADYTKRIQKTDYTKSIVKRLISTREKTLLIAGWWQNELTYFSLQNPNPMVKFVYYVDQATLEKFKSEGFKIYFLPEQNYFNDLRFKDEFTDELADPFGIYRF